MNSAVNIPSPSAPDGGFAPWPSNGASPHRSATAHLLIVLSLVASIIIVICGVSNMRTSLSRLHSAGRSIQTLNQLFGTAGANQNMETPAVTEHPVMPELTPLQQIALLRMTSSTLCRGVSTYLQASVQVMPRIDDYRALVALDLAVLPPNGRWHVSTALGDYYARQIAMQKAQGLGIHFMIEGTQRGARISYRCACGNWSVSYPRGRYTDSNAQIGFSRHLDHIRDTPAAESA